MAGSSSERVISRRWSELTLRVHLALRLPGRWRVVIGLCIVLATVPAFGATPDEVVRRYLGMVYDGPPGALPRAANVDTARFEQQIRNVRRVRCLRADQIAISIVKEEPDHVTVHADVALARGNLGSAVWSAVEIVPLRIELTRDGTEWVIAAVQNRDDEFAEEILRRDKEGRERLFVEEAGRVSKGLGRAFYALAMASLNTAKWADAKDAAALARRIAVEVGDRGGEALAIAAESYSAAVVHDFEGAKVMARESLKIAQSVGDPDVLARAWYDYGRQTGPFRWDPDRPLRAPEQLAAYENAARLGEQAEDPTIRIRALYSLANIAANAQSDYQTARRRIEHALVIAREVGDASGEMGLESVLATVYFKQGDWERGVFHNERAMKMAERLQAFAYPTFLIRSAFALLHARQFGEARAAFARVLTTNEAGVATTTKGLVPGPVLGSAFRALAVIEAESGNLSEAECLNRESARHHLGSTNAYLFELAPYHAQRGDDATALAFALASVAESALHAEDKVAALVAAARAYRRLGMVDLAIGAALEAIEIREGIDSRISGDERQRALASQATSDSYEVAAEIALDRGDPLEALAFLERGRARVLTDILENGRPGSMAQADAALQARLAALDGEVARIRNELERARESALPRRAVTRLNEQLSEARSERASFADGVRAWSQRRQGIRHQADAGRILEHGKRLPPGTVAVEYFLGDSVLHIFVISRDTAGGARVVARENHVDRATVERTVDDFLRMLSDSDLRVESAARKVYDILIKPVADEISAARALLIVPDDFIWSVPFAALVDHRGRFLVEQHAIVYAPSVTAYAAIADSRARRPAAASLLAVGNPALNGGSATASSHRDDTALASIREAELEAKAVGALYDPRTTVVLTRQQATEGRSREALSQATIAHFATHAILDDNSPMYSYLMLADDQDAASDGRLESWEVAQLNLNADLVVLSACETARGRVGGGEGVLGLAWSFLLAGAHSVVATQWKVASHSTAELMIAFHRSLRAEKGSPALQKALSLREAQLHLLRSAQTRHPFHWAPFVLLGDPSALNPAQ
jgi:CHAT domain-containing protein